MYNYSCPENQTEEAVFSPMNVVGFNSLVDVAVDADKPENDDQRGKFCTDSQLVPRNYGKEICWNRSKKIWYEGSMAKVMVNYFGFFHHDDSFGFVVATVERQYKL